MIIQPTPATFDQICTDTKLKECEMTDNLVGH